MSAVNDATNALQGETPPEIRWPSMNVQQFEQEILKLAFETNARITAASVAYYLGLPSREANRMLNELLQQGVIELDSDDDGNLFYRVPEQQSSKDIFDFDEASIIIDDSRELEEEILAAATAKAEEVEEIELDESDLDIADVTTEPRGIESIELVSADAEHESEPFSPSRNRPPEISAQRAADGSSAAASAAATGSVSPPPKKQPPTPERSWHAPPRSPVWQDHDEDGGGGFSGHAASMPPKQQPAYSEQFDAVQRVQQPGQQREPFTPTRGVFGGVTARSMEPDAWVGNCGASSVVVKVDTRCEPKPLSEARPMIVSCVDPEEERARQAHMQQVEQQGAQQWWASQTQQHQSQSTALVLAENQNLPATLDDIEQPEHQPGMALLLSLILCGTGQIYNGEVSKGIMMMVLCFLLWFVLLGWVVHIWSIVDAVVVAERINRRQHA